MTFVKSVAAMWYERWYSWTVHHSYPTSDTAWKVLIFSVLFAHCPTCVRRKSCGFARYVPWKSVTKRRVSAILSHSVRPRLNFFPKPEGVQSGHETNLLAASWGTSVPSPKTPETTLKGNCLAFLPSPSSMSSHSLKHDPNNGLPKDWAHVWLTTKQVLDCQGFKTVPNQTHFEHQRVAKQRLSDLSKLNHKFII